MVLTREFKLKSWRGLRTTLPESLIRMLEPSGNPPAKNLFEILSAQEEAHAQFKLKAFGAAAGG